MGVGRNKFLFAFVYFSLFSGSRLVGISKKENFNLLYDDMSKNLSRVFELELFF